MSIPVVSISLVNPQSAGTGPFDHAALIRSFLPTVPVGLRQRVVWWLPGLANLSLVPLPVGEKMPFEQKITRYEWDVARYSADFDDCEELIAYVGCWGASAYGTAEQRAQALYPYRQIGGTTLWFDNADGYEGDSPEAAMVRAWIEKGRLYTVGIESNFKRAWIADLIAKHPGRVEIIAESWLFAASEPGGCNGWEMNKQGKRWRWKEVIDMGAVPVSLVARRVNSDGNGWTGVSEAEWPAFKADLCERAVKAGGRACLRPTKDMSAALLARVEKLNAA